MKKGLILPLVLFFLSFNVFGQTILELDNSQSMSITGKGPGQDGAINPYSDKESIAIVENIGKNNFSIRIQEQGAIIEEINIEPNEKKNIPLRKGREMYFDSELKATAKVDFKEKDD